MNILRTAIDTAVGAAIAEHPKYFTPKGQEKARALIVRKVMAALRDDGDDSPSANEADKPPEQAPFVLADATSREARGYINLRKIAGAVAPSKTGAGMIPIKATAHQEPVFALADLPMMADWPFLTEPGKIGAWMEFFGLTLGDTPRRSIFETRDGKRGICMPFYFPPSKTGKIYDAVEAA